MGCSGPDVVGVSMSRRMRCGAPCIENSGQRQGLRGRRGSPDSGLSLLTGKTQEKFSSQRFQKSPDVGLCSELLALKIGYRPPWQTLSYSFHFSGPPLHGNGHQEAHSCHPHPRVPSSGTVHFSRSGSSSS